MNSPFKFLDSYTKADKDIFFGRNREIEELYQKVFESKVLLLYGVSGTGKSSLIDCGLGNKIADSDWLRVNVRRGNRMIESLWRQLENLDLSSQDSGKQAPIPNGISGEQIIKKIKSVYLDHFKPIYLIFDQFEELFIFGSKEEQQDFVLILKSILEADLQCKILISLRAEYLADITKFEGVLPGIIDNRMRIEKMSRTNALEVISGPCEINGIKLEEGFEDALLSKLVPEGSDVELTYLQVYLDKVFRQGQATESSGFSISQLDRLGDVGDLLGSFLEEQISELEDPETGLTILKSFVSVKGTKRQITHEEVLESCRSLGRNPGSDTLKELINKFVDLRILRDKDDNGHYELRHDSLASKIYEKITLVEKELMEIRQFIANAYANYEKRDVYLTIMDLKYIAPYEDKLFLNKATERFIEDSKQNLQKVRKRIKRVAIAGFVAVMIIALGHIFKYFHWPGTAIINSMGIFIYTIGFLPLFVYYLFIRKENRTINLLLLAFSLLLVGSILLSSKRISPDALRGAIIETELRVNADFEDLSLKNELIFSAIIQYTGDQQEKADYYIKLAARVNDQSEELSDEIEDMKIAMVAVHEPESPASKGGKIIISKVESIADNNVPAQIMIIMGKGNELKHSLQEYKTFLLDELVQNNDPQLARSISNYINKKDIITEEGRTIPWEVDKFEHLPMGAVLLNLLYIQLDIKNAEFLAYSYLAEQLKIDVDDL